MASTKKKPGLQCPCNRHHCPGKRFGRITTVVVNDPRSGVGSQDASRRASQSFGELLTSDLVDTCSSECVDKIRRSGKRIQDLKAKQSKDHVERVRKGWVMGVAYDSPKQERIEDQLARVRAAEYLNTTAEQYTNVAGELLILRQQRQAKLAEQLRLMGALPDVPYDAQIVRGMIRDKGGEVVRKGHPRMRGLSWSNPPREIKVDGLRADEDRASCENGIELLQVVRNSQNQVSLAQTVNCISEKIMAGSACENMMPTRSLRTSYREI